MTRIVIKSHFKKEDVIRIKSGDKPKLTFPSSYTGYDVTIMSEPIVTTGGENVMKIKKTETIQTTN